MVEQPVDVVDDLSRVVVGDLTRPARSDALGSVDQHHGDDGNVPLRLHLLVVIVQELEQVGVPRREQQLGEWTAGKENVNMTARSTDDGMPLLCSLLRHLSMVKM